MRFDRTLIGQALVRATLTLAACATALPIRAAPSAEDFARHPFIGDVAISPSGNRLALAVRTDNGRVQLAVMNLQPPSAPKAIAGFVDAEVTDVDWVNDERIVFHAQDLDTVGAESAMFPGTYSAGVFAIDHDGSGQRELIARRRFNWSTGSSIPSKALTWNWDLDRTLDDGTPDVIVRESQYDAHRDLRHVLLSRLNTVTGSVRSISVGAPDAARAWLLDEKGEPRFVTTYDKGRRTIHWRQAPDKPWSAVGDFELYGERGFTPRFVDPRGDVFVSSSQDRDTSAFYRFDPVGKKIDAEPMVSMQGFDIGGAEILTDSSTGHPLGVRYLREQEGTHWFDPALAKIQQGIDDALPGRSNRLICKRCESTRFFVVQSQSDRVPGELYLFDRSTAKLQLLLSTRPWIKAAEQGRRTYQRIAARDGLPLPVYLTTPPGAPAGQPLPAVLLVHGGPWLRGHDLGWDAEAQFLASRGYLVIQTDYRGSRGYGWKHFRASWKEWGQAMQDDLADSVQWAVKQGLADPKRICIAGASYGGYAALMGVVRDPALYRCAVAFAAVTDIDLMYSITWSDFPEMYKRYGMPVLVGDRKADAERLAAASPLQQAARIRVPVLLAHGGQDRRVPIEHALKFRGEAEKAGVKIEWVSYPDEGHGFYLPAHQADYWIRMDKFIKQAMSEAAR